MNTNKKIKVDVEFEYPVSRVVKWADSDIIVNENLDLAGILSFANYISDACFDSETGEYLPEVFEFATKCAVVEYYTNIELPTEAVDKYAFVYGTDIIEVINDNINKDQLSQTIDSVWMKVQHLAQSNVERVREEINNIASSLTELEEKMRGSLAGFDDETISNLVAVISGNALDEEKLVKAIVESGSMSKVEK